MTKNAREVAEWMLNKLNQDGILYQEDAAFEIESQFGEEFVYINDNGNTAISKRVLAEFRKLTEDTVVWVRGEKYWRRRESYDEQGRGQPD